MAGLSVLSARIEFLISSRKPLNLSMRGVVGGGGVEGTSWMPGTSLRVHDVCEMREGVW